MSRTSIHNTHCEQHDLIDSNKKHQRIAKSVQTANLFQNKFAFVTNLFAYLVTNLSKFCSCSGHVI